MRYTEDVLDEVMTTASFGDTVPERMGGLSIGPGTTPKHLLVANKIEGDGLNSATGAMGNAVAAYKSLYEALDIIIQYLKKLDQ